MKGTILEKIIRSKRATVDRERAVCDIDGLKALAASTRSAAEARRLRTALSHKDRINIIAEIKRASPSKGVINGDIDVANVAAAYERGGAAAISVLTEDEYFRGSLDDLIAARAAVGIPILRKDFIVDEFQIYQSAAAGADVILLIAAALGEKELAHFLALAREELGMDAIVEVHTDDEQKVAISAGADIIGVNNRNLHTFDVSLDVSKRLISERPPGALMITESGLSTRAEIDELRGLGFDGFLIGETLMRSGDPADLLKQWT